MMKWTSTQTDKARKRCRCWAAALALVAAAGSGCGSNATPPKEATAPTPAQGETLRIPRLMMFQQGPVKDAVSKAGTAWKVVSNVQWGFAGVVPFSEFGKIGLNGAVLVRARVTKGKVGFGLLTPAKTLLNEQYMSAAPDVQSISIPFPAEKLQDFIVRSAEEKGVSSEVLVEAVDYVLTAVKLPNQIPMEKGVPYDSAMIAPGPPVRVVTAPRKYAYAVRIPLPLEGISKPVLARIRGRVVQGLMGIGVLGQDQKTFQSEEYFEPADEAGDLFIVVPSPATAGFIILRSGKDMKSEISIDSLSLYSPR